MRYVVANPSTYLYPTLVRESRGDFVVPNLPNCTDYDSWHYGLQSPQGREALFGR